MLKLPCNSPNHEFVVVLYYVTIRERVQHGGFGVEHVTAGMRPRELWPKRNEVTRRIITVLALGSHVL